MAVELTLGLLCVVAFLVLMWDVLLKSRLKNIEKKIKNLEKEKKE